MTPLAIDKSFTVSASLYFGVNDDLGADGIAFVLQNKGSSVVGIKGGGMGLGGISPSLGVTFDTFMNPHDPTEDHVAVVLDGMLVKGILAGPLPFPGNQQIEDGVFHDVIFEWLSGTKTLNVYWQGSTSTLITTKVDLVSILGSDSAYLGFTSSTGQYSNRLEVCIKSLIGTIFTSAPSNQPSMSSSANPSSNMIPSRISYSPTKIGRAHV